jgi:hypothetical protein
LGVYDGAINDSVCGELYCCEWAGVKTVQQSLIVVPIQPVMHWLDDDAVLCGLYLIGMLLLLGAGFLIA